MFDRRSFFKTLAGAIASPQSLGLKVAAQAATPAFLGLAAKLVGHMVSSHCGHYSSRSVEEVRLVDGLFEVTLSPVSPQHAYLGPLTAWKRFLVHPDHATEHPTNSADNLLKVLKAGQAHREYAKQALDGYDLARLFEDPHPQQVRKLAEEFYSPEELRRARKVFRMVRYCDNHWAPGGNMEAWHSMCKWRLIGNSHSADFQVLREECLVRKKYELQSERNRLKFARASRPAGMGFLRKLRASVVREERAADYHNARRICNERVRVLLWSDAYRTRRFASLSNRYELWHKIRQLILVGVAEYSSEEIEHVGSYSNYRLEWCLRVLRRIEPEIQVARDAIEFTGKTWIKHVPEHMAWKIERFVDRRPWLSWLTKKLRTNGIRETLEKWVDSEFVSNGWQD